MIIDTINILEDYELKQSKLEGFLDLPARKRILADQLNTAKDIVFEEYDITVTMFGQYGYKADLATIMSWIKSLVIAKQVHDISFPSHGYSCKGVFNNGIQTNVYPNNIIEIIMKITVTE